MRLLLITYHFPPDSAIGAVRPYQFARLLPAHGVEAWVLTVQPEFAESIDHHSMIDGIPPGRILRTPVEKTRRRRVIEALSTINITVGCKPPLAAAGCSPGSLSQTV
jgi:hypothetical protein